MNLLWKYKLPGEVKIQIIKELLRGPKKNIELILKLKYSKSALGNHLRWLIKKGVIDRNVEKNVTTYFIKDRYIAREFIKDPLSLMKCKKIKTYGLSQLKLLKLVNDKPIRYSTIKKNLGLSKSVIIKLLRRLRKKGFINKRGKKGWIITDRGRKITLLENNKARYQLYANVK